MSRHRVSLSPFLSSSYTTQLHYTNSYTYSQPQLPTVHYTDTRPTRNVVCPSGAWIENRPHSTSSIRLARNPKHVIVQWVGIGTPICLTYWRFCFLYRPSELTCWMNLVDMIIYDGVVLPTPFSSAVAASLHPPWAFMAYLEEKEEFRTHNMYEFQTAELTLTKFKLKCRPNVNSLIISLEMFVQRTVRFTQHLLRRKRVHCVTWCRQECAQA